MDGKKCVPLLLDALDQEFKQPREKRGRYQQPGTLAKGDEDLVIFACAAWLGVCDKSCAPTIEEYIGKGNKDMDYCLAEILIRLDRTRVHKDLLVEGATRCSSPNTRSNIIAQLWQVDDPKVEGILKKAANDPCATTESMRATAKQSLRYLEMKRHGHDPLDEERARLQKSVDDTNKRNAERHPTPPSSGGSNK
jgi:hypothetical protein